MNKIYLNIKQREESRIIVVRNNRLVDFEQEFQGEESQKGNVYKGVVVNIEPSLEAAFVDFGEKKNGLLPLRDIPAGARGVSEGGLAIGDKLLVQIKKDNVGDKGAGLTGLVSLAGRFLVLQSHRQQTVGISSNATPAERKDMGEIMATLPVPENMGVIARSLALSHSREDILWDLQSYLLPLWEKINSAYESQDDPVMIYCENNLLLRMMRDHFRPDSGDVVVCDDEEQYKMLVALVETLFPDNIGQIQYHGSADNMVPAAIEEKIEQIYMREVSVASGVRLVFDTTEAMVTIDVNSGRQRKGGNIEETAFKTNLEAAEIIAEQLRLRNLGGLVVIDFIDMQKRENCEALERRFSELMRKDRARIRMGKISEFGLMELSRQRTSRSLLYSQTQPCQRCGGSGQVWREESFALSLLRKMRTVAFSKGGGSIVVQMPREVAVFLLNEKRFELQQIEDNSGCNIVITPDNRLFPPQYKIKAHKGDTSSAMGLVNQMAKQEEADEYRYKKPDPYKAKEAMVQNMLPSERMPSKQVTRGGKGAKGAQGAGAGAGANSQGGFFRRVMAALFSDKEEAAQDKGRQKPDAQRRGKRGGRTQERQAEGGRSSRQRSQQRREDNAGRDERQRAPQRQDAQGEGRGESRGEGRSARNRRPRRERDRDRDRVRDNKPAAAPDAAPAQTVAPAPTPPPMEKVKADGASAPAPAPTPAVTSPTESSPSAPSAPKAAAPAPAQEQKSAAPAPVQATPPPVTPPKAGSPAPAPKVLPPIVRSNPVDSKPATPPPAKTEATPPPTKTEATPPPAKVEATPPPAKTESTPPLNKPAATEWMVPGGDAGKNDAMKPQQSGTSPAQSEDARGGSQG